MSYFEEILESELELSHRWRISISKDALGGAQEVLLAVSLNYAVTPLSLANGRFRNPDVQLKEPTISMTLLGCEESQTGKVNADKFPESWFIDWLENNRDEETGASNVFLNKKLMRIERLDFDMNSKNAYEFSGYVVPASINDYLGTNEPNFRNLSLTFIIVKNL